MLSIHYYTLMVQFSPFKEYKMFWWTAYYNAIDRMVMDYQVQALKTVTRGLFEVASRAQRSLEVK